MKPSTLKTLRLLREHDSVTTHDLLVAGCGSRYSARIHELRHVHGFVIEEQRLTGDVNGSRYRLVAEPEDFPQRRPSGEQPTGTAGGRVDPCEGVAAPSQPEDFRPLGQGHPDSGGVGLFDADVFRDRTAYA